MAAPVVDYATWRWILLLSEAAAERADAVAALSPLVGAIDEHAMRRANMHVDVDGGSVGEAARRLDRELREAMRETGGKGKR